MNISARLSTVALIAVFGLSFTFANCTPEPSKKNETHTEKQVTNDAGTADTGTADTGSADTGSADTGSADTGTVDTGTVVEKAPMDKGSNSCGSDPSLKTVVWPIIKVGCGCHAGGAGRLKFASAAELLGLVGKASRCNGKNQIVAGKADESYFIQKMENTAGICGGVMPTSGKLPQADIDKVKAWICNGAKDN